MSFIVNSLKIFVFEKRLFVENETPDLLIFA